MNRDINNKYLMIRILGNDLDGLHGSHQTLENLAFTLENEYNFSNCKKMFVLNRIVSIEEKKKIINLLNRYNIEFIDIPFNIYEFKKLPRNLPPLSIFKNRSELVRCLYSHNLYLVNNNGCRNWCITYGKKMGYTWTFVLDSNSFLTKEAFKNIVDNIDTKTEYIIIPQKRLKDGNLSNDILKKDYKNLINKLPIQEPQIAFKNTSDIMFNPLIPYSLAPKAELLNALNVPGKWSKWMDFYGLNIKPRKFKNVNYKSIAYIIRLNPFSINNDIKNNWFLRWKGVYSLVQKINSMYR